MRLCTVVMLDSKFDDHSFSCFTLVFTTQFLFIGNFYGNGDEDGNLFVTMGNWGWGNSYGDGENLMSMVWGWGQFSLPCHSPQQMMA